MAGCLLWHHISVDRVQDAVALEGKVVTGMPDEEADMSLGLCGSRSRREVTQDDMNTDEARSDYTNALSIWYSHVQNNFDGHSWCELVVSKLLHTTVGQDGLTA